MLNRKLVYTSIMIVISVCTTILYHFLQHRPCKAIYTKDFADPTTKMFRFEIVAEKDAVSLYIDGEAQFKYSPENGDRNHSISFYFPHTVPDKAEILGLQVTTWADEE